GKGLVQTVFPLDNGWALKLTTGKWYTPSGRTIQRPSHDVGLHAVETSAAGDSTLGESARADSARPVYHSDGGRPVYGGGAITPDVIVRLDTLVGADRELARVLAPRLQDVYLALYDLGASLVPTVRPDFRVTAAWRDDLYRRLTKRGVAVDRAVYDAGRQYVDRMIENRVAIMAFGDSAARRRSVAEDAPLRTALHLLEQGGSQHDILATVPTQK
ncbi:MAG TPA: S41 family peptidase, partial [Gemmatimonadales bacterium]|nr:S41 family peptidase [Gemmatimonadales bacterium]